MRQRHSAQRVKNEEEERKERTGFAPNKNSTAAPEKVALKWWRLVFVCVCVCVRACAFTAGATCPFKQMKHCLVKKKKKKEKQHIYLNYVSSIFLLATYCSDKLTVKRVFLKLFPCSLCTSLHLYQNVACSHSSTITFKSSCCPSIDINVLEILFHNCN